MLIDLVLNWDEDVAKSYKYINKDDGTLESEVEKVLVRQKSCQLWNAAWKLYNSDGDCIGAIEIVRDITKIKKAEEIHNRYEILASQSRDIILFINAANGRILEANHAAVKAYGYSHAELLSMSVSDLPAPSKSHLVSSHLTEMIKGIIFETEHKKKDGSTFPVEVSSKSTVIGSESALICLIRDITERRQTEQALRESEARLRALVDNLPFDCWAIGADGRYAIQNSVSKNRWGNQLGKSAQDVKVPPALKERWAATNQAAFSGKIVIDEVEYVHHGQSGVYQEIIAPIRVEGRIQGILGVNIDITERKRAEQKLRESERRLSAIFTRAAAGLCEISTEGGFINVNDELCKILGRTREELLTMRMMDVTHPDDADPTLASWKRLLDQDQPASLDKRYVRPDGSIVFANSSLTRLGDQQDLAETILAVVIDISERKKAKEALEQRVAERTAELEKHSREYRDLAHRTIQAMENDRKILSKELHDSIGGTLAALIYQIQGRIEEMNSKPPPAVFPFEKILAHLQDTIKETRYISKQLRPSILDDFGLTAAINDTIRDFREFYPTISITSDIHIDEADISDSIKTVIYRVIQEALNNVAKHSQADTVKIGLNKTNSLVHFQVEDNGIGFDPYEIFGDKVALTGYGLRSMKERVEICKGKLQVVSGPGEGTLIDVIIPIKLRLKEK